MIKLRDFIFEASDFVDEESPAAKDAKAQGLEYMSFGRWGKDGKVTHHTDTGKLVAIPADQQAVWNMPSRAQRLKNRVVHTPAPDWEARRAKTDADGRIMAQRTRAISGMNKLSMKGAKTVLGAIVSKSSSQGTGNWSTEGMGKVGDIITQLTGTDKPSKADTMWLATKLFKRTKGDQITPREWNDDAVVTVHDPDAAA